MPTDLRQILRNSHRWALIRKAVLRKDDTCWQCGKPGSTTVDHIVPISLGGALLDPANLRPAHLTCNSKRGDGTKGTNHEQSEDWFA